MSDFAAVIPQLPTLLVYGLGAIALMAIGVILVLLLEALCMLGLGIHYAERGRRDSTRKPALLALVAAICCAAFAPLAAQGAGQQVRTIEPRMTRLFSDDSLEIRAFGGPVLSPDGQWVLFCTDSAETASLWVVPAAGGDLVRLTSGRYADGRPAWFPSGDRIAFLSDRPSAPGNPQSYVMVLPLDPRTRRAAGPPQQVTLEPAMRFAVSPDGQSIAYSTRRDTVFTLMVIPSTGGSARTLSDVRGPDMTRGVHWSRDGAFVYFTQRRTGTQVRRIARVPVAGGSAQEVGTVPMREGPSFAISPGAEFVLMQTEQGPAGAPGIEVATIEGRPIARFALPRNMSATGFTPDGRGLMAVRSNMVAPIRIVPVAGGPSRQVTEARGYDWPLGWSEDGSRLYVQTQANGHDAVLEIPVNGGPATQWVLPAGARQTFVPSPNGRHYLYSLTEPSSSGDLRTLVVQSLVGGNTRVVTRAAYVRPPGPSTRVTGPGGSRTNDGEFLYFERRGSRLELWTTPPEGPARLLRAFPSSYAGRTGFGVHGNRIAYTEQSGDSTTLLVAEGTNGRPRTVAKVAGSAAAPVWSHDGRWLAFDYYAPRDGSRYAVLLIGVGANGTLAAPPRMLEAGPQLGWQIEWLPDDRAFTVFGMTGQANRTDVFLVSLREGERPVALAQDDPSTRWGYELSPDGRYVAYPAEISRGSSIWRLDLGNVLAEGRRGTHR